ncbi:hypothetical protein CRPA5_30920 [Pseudomonas aeruginosa]
MIKDELHRYGVRQRPHLQCLAVAHLQPAGPIGEGAAVAAHGIGGGTGGNECGSGGTGLGIEAINGKRGEFTVQWKYRIIHYVQRIEK